MTKEEMLSIYASCGPQWRVDRALGIEKEGWRDYALRKVTEWLTTDCPIPNWR
jgi:hypothetical protein